MEIHLVGAIGYIRCRGLGFQRSLVLKVLLLHSTIHQLANNPNVAILIYVVKE